MVYEVAIQTVDPAKRDEYLQVFGKALKEANFAGAHEAKMLLSMEHPSRVVVLIEWDSVEAHTAHRGTPPHTHLREIGARYQTAKSDGAHYIAYSIRDLTEA